MKVLKEHKNACLMARTLMQGPPTVWNLEFTLNPINTQRKLNKVGHPIFIFISVFIFSSHWRSPMCWQDSNDRL